MTQRKLYSLVLSLLLCTNTFAQLRRPERPPTSSAVFKGTVRDSFGFPLANAVVLVASRSFERGAVTNGDGLFSIGNLDSGTYELTVTLGNFPSYRASGIILQANEQRSIDVQLAIEDSISSFRSATISDATVSEGISTADIDALRRPEPSTRVESEAAIAPVVMPDFVPVKDRWSIPQFPEDDEVVDSAWNPYNQNLLKGDYPMFGNRWFFALTGTSSTIGESGFDRNFSPNLFLTTDLFRGITAFRPADLRFRITTAVNAREFEPALQEAFVEARVAVTSPKFDFLSIRAGVQPFNSDFRGFIFFSSEPGIRLFGNLLSNKHQYNVAYFRVLEKQAKSFLNTFHTRNQEVFIANYYVEDFFRSGYTAQFSFHQNRMGPLLANYFGWTGDGHLGRFNVNHSFYQMDGNEALGDSRAQLGALEVSFDQDWKRYRASAMYSTRGFDGIIDNAPFAGGTASFWNLRGLNRTRAERIRSSFVNPAVLLLNTGVDSDLTPKLRMSINGNVVTLPGGRGSGLDTGVGLRWRPLLNNNVVVNAGLAKMFPTESLRMMFASKPLVSSLVELRLTY